MYTPVVVTNAVSIAGGKGAGVSATCPTGYVATGGGVESMTKLPAGLTILATNPVYTQGSPPTGWYGNALNETTSALTLTAYVICMPKS
jgi:hypothetical protein